VCRSVVVVHNILLVLRRESDLKKRGKILELCALVATLSSKKLLC
jgi:hypothetical protein